METNSFIKFETTPESEKRYTMKASSFQLAVTSGAIKIYKMLQIDQKWIMEGDRYTGRIRKTVDVTTKKKNKLINYEHTVKHHVSKGLDYEVTTDINAEDYALLSKVYKDKLLQSKLRIYVTDHTGDYDKYIITVDIPDDKPEICWVEFESNDSNVEKEKFVKPSWVQEIEE